MWLVFTCIVFASWLQPIIARPGVLRLEEHGSYQDFTAVLAEWSCPDSAVRGKRIMQPKSDMYGCDSYGRCVGCAVFVHQGECTFAKKALNAQRAGAVLLIVARSEDGPPKSMGFAITVPSRQMAPLRIKAVMVSRLAGRKISVALQGKRRVSATCWSYGLVAHLLNEVFVGVLAIVLVTLGAYFSVEDLRHPDRRATAIDDVQVVDDHTGPHFLLFGSVMLTLLFFFMKYLIYVLLLVFALSAFTTTAAILEPALARWRPSLRLRKIFRLPPKMAEFLNLPEEHSLADVAAESVGLFLAISFLLFRNSDSVGWIFQDVIAAMLLVTIQCTLRLPNLRIGTGMLVCMFLFDIFWVFVSPTIFKKSVMIEVATGGGTGQSVPMVLKIPGLVPGDFKILGLGDIAIPGLLISFLMRHDMLKGLHWRSGYFAAGVAGYAAGLAATFVSLYLMQHGQPALLFLVPGTLLPTFALARRRSELNELWTADYGPHLRPEGYDHLNDEAGKRA